MDDAGRGLVLLTAMTACGGKDGGVRMGSLSDFDSLSYSLGANIGYGMNHEMKDIPFDFKAIDKGIKEGRHGVRPRRSTTSRSTCCANIS